MEGEVWKYILGADIPAEFADELTIDKLGGSIPGLLERNANIVKTGMENVSLFVRVTDDSARDKIKYRLLSLATKDSTNQTRIEDIKFFMIFDVIFENVDTMFADLFTIFLLEDRKVVTNCSTPIAKAIWYLH